MSATLFSGKTVDDAIAEGLRVLGLRQSDVEVEVVSRGSRGLFGIGSEPAQVRLTPRQVAAPSVAAPVAAAPEDHRAAPQPVAERAADIVASPGEPTADEREPAPVDEPVVSTAKPVPAPVLVNQPAADVEITAEDEAMAVMSTDLLLQTVQLMGFEAQASAAWQAPDEDNKDAYLLLELHGRDLGALIGRRGETLNSLQYLLRLMVNQRIHAWRNIVVDVENYRLRRAEHLTQLALRSADQVTATGRTLALEPMPASERRIIHIALRDHPTVFTESSGEGERRKIQIVPKRA